MGFKYIDEGTIPHFLYTLHGGNLILIFIIIINPSIYFIILLLIKDLIEGMHPEKLSF